MSNNEASTSDASDNEAQGLGLGNGSTKTDTTQLNSEGNDSAHGAVEMSALMANAKAEPAEEKSPGTEAKKMKQKSAKETTREEEDENEDHEGEPSKCRSRFEHNRRFLPCESFQCHVVRFSESSSSLTCCCRRYALASSSWPAVNNHLQ